MKAIGITVASVIGLLLVFVCVDCSSGVTKHYDCRVSGRHHVAAWVETRVSSDSDGNISTSVIHHPEEFHLFCDDFEDSTRTFDVRTTSVCYNTITNGESVVVRVRQGKWTGIGYLPSIVESRE